MPVLLNPQGVAKDISDVDVPGLLEIGWVQPSDSELAAHQQAEAAKAEEEKYNTTGQLIKTGAEGLARGLTFGGSDWLENKILDNGAEIKAREEHHPILGFGSEAVGMVLPMLIPGVGEAGLAADAAKGVSVTSKAAKAYEAIRSALALTPAGVGGTASRAVTEGVARMLPETTGLLGRVTERAIAEGLGSVPMSLEMAVGHALHENAIGNPNYTAEALMANPRRFADDVGEYAVFGAAFGSLIGGGGTLVTDVTRRSANAVRETVSSSWKSLKQSYLGAEAFTGMEHDVSKTIFERRQELLDLSKIVPDLSKTIDAANPKTAKVIAENAQRLGELEKQFPGITNRIAPLEPENARYVIDNWHLKVGDPKTMDGLNAKFGESVQALYDEIEGALRTANSKMRPEETARILKNEMAGIDPRRTALEATSLVNDSINRIKSDPAIYRQGAARELGLIQESLDREIAASVAPEDYFQAIKKARQTVDDNLAVWKKEPSAGNQKTIGEARQLRRDLAKMLEDENAWGSAGKRQGEFNKAQHGFFNDRTAFEKEFTSKRIVDGREVRQVDPSKVYTWFSRMSDERGKFKAKALDAFFGSTDKVIGEIAKSAKASGMPFDEVATRAAFEQTKAMAKEIEAKVGFNNYLRKTDARIPWGHSVPIADGPAGIALNIAGGLPLVGNTVEKVTRVAEKTRSVSWMAMRAAQVEEMAQAVVSKQEAMSALAKNNEHLTRGIAGDLARILTSPTLMLKAAAVPAVEAIAKSDRKADERAKEFERRAIAIRGAASPAVLQGRISALNEAWSGYAPQTAMATAATAARGVQFLASKLPAMASASTEDILSGESKVQASPAQVERFDRYYQAVTDPRSILKNVAAGKVTIEEVEAVRTVYPHIYQEIQRAALDALQKSKGKIPRNVRSSLDLLVGMPPSRGAAMVQDTFAKGAASKPQAAPKQTKKAPEHAADRLALHGDRDS